MASNWVCKGFWYCDGVGGVVSSGGDVATFDGALFVIGNNVGVVMRHCYRSNFFGPTHFIGISRFEDWDVVFFMV